MKTTGGTKTTYGAMTDRQGSLRALYNGSGLVQSFSYDAWGNRRNPSTGATLTTSELVAANSITARGYTCHEHMDEFGLINMNARIYDPALGMFISVDPLAQEYYNTYPYAYCGGDPVNRVDWTGEDWYEDPYGNMFWREGHDKIEGYTNIGATATISWGEDIVFNYYQNMGILGDKPADAIDLIASSPYLMQQAFSESSRLSTESQKVLFAKIQSRGKAELGREAGLYFVGELAGGLVGKFLCWTFGKAVGWIAGKFIGTADNVIAPAVKGYTKSNLKLGQQMHKMYKINEVVEGIAVKEYSKIKGIRPDFVDFRTKTIYELKPNNPRAIKQGWKQLYKYQEKFQQQFGGNWNIVLDLY